MRHFWPCNALGLADMREISLSKKHIEVIYGFESEPQICNRAIKELAVDYCCEETVKIGKTQLSQTLRLLEWTKPQIVNTLMHTGMVDHFPSNTEASLFLTKDLNTRSSCMWCFSNQGQCKILFYIQHLAYIFNHLHFFVFCFQELRLSYVFKGPWAVVLQISDGLSVFFEHWPLFHSFSVL